MMPSRYECRPVPQRGQTVGLCLFLLIAAVLCFFASTRLLYARAFLQLVTVVLLFFFIQINLKFLLTEYRYLLENGGVSLYARQGKKERYLGCVLLEEDVLFLSRGSLEKQKKELRIRRRFSVTRAPTVHKKRDPADRASR